MSAIALRLPSPPPSTHLVSAKVRQFERKLSDEKQSETLLIFLAEFFKSGKDVKDIKPIISLLNISSVKLSKFCLKFLETYQLATHSAFDLKSKELKLRMIHEQLSQSDSTTLKEKAEKAQADVNFTDGVQRLSRKHLIKLLDQFQTAVGDVVSEAYAMIPKSPPAGHVFDAASKRFSTLAQ